MAMPSGVRNWACDYMNGSVEGQTNGRVQVEHNVGLASFSVVIPLYNKRDFVRRTLATVLAQTLPAHEIIIVDDESTDRGAESIADLLGERVTLVRQTNAGPGLARNHGAAIASGEWIALIDADDLWHPRHLENLAGVIAAFPDADVVAAASQQQSADAIDLDLAQLPDARPHRLDYFCDPDYRLVHTSSIAIRRTAYAASGGFGPLFPGEDPEFWARLALDYTFALSPVPTSIYVRGSGGLMDNYDAQFGGDLVKRDPASDPSSFPNMIANALSDRRYATRHRDIAAFADRAMLKAAKNMLYTGNGAGARYALDLLRDPGGSSTARVYRALSYLPDAILTAGARAFSRIKRAV